MVQTIFYPVLRDGRRSMGGMFFINVIAKLDRNRFLR